MIKHNSGDWIGTSRRLDEAPSDCTFRRELQNSKSRRIQLTGLDPDDWINCLESGRNPRPREFRPLDWIQPTGLINPNQAETPNFENPGDWIRANLVLKKAHLCFKAFRTQGPLNPICLGSEVRIREED